MKEVKCPNCKRVFWETTDKFNPDIAPNGSMLRLLQPYRGNNWPIFGDGVMPKGDGTGTMGTLSAEMDCPQCLAQLAPSGRLMVIDDVPTPISPMEAGIAGDEETARPGKSVKTAKLKAPEKKQAPKEHRETTLKP